MVPQYAAAALVSENKILAHPACADSIPTSAGQEDHVSMGTISARKARTIIEHVQTVLGIEWMCASQAIDLQDRLQLGRGTLKAYELLRKHVTFIEEDGVFYQDQKNAASLIADGSPVEMIESTLARLE